MKFLLKITFFTLYHISFINVQSMQLTEMETRQNSRLSDHNQQQKEFWQNYDRSMHATGRFKLLIGTAMFGIYGLFFYKKPFFEASSFDPIFFSGSCFFIDGINHLGYKTYLTQQQDGMATREKSYTTYTRIWDFILTKLLRASSEKKDSAYKEV